MKETSSISVRGFKPLGGEQLLENDESVYELHVSNEETLSANECLWLFLSAYEFLALLFSTYEFLPLLLFSVVKEVSVHELRDAKECRSGFEAGGILITTELRSVEETLE